MTMLDVQKYRKKPVEIEAYCYDQKRENYRPDWLMDAVTANTVITYPDHAIIKTLEGNMRAELGDWIIKGVKGELYPCKPDIFEATYEPALSTVTPAEVGGMVERLRYAENVAINDSHAAQTELSSTPAADNEYADNRAKLCAAVEETISLIQSQAARIAELEAGLMPFAQRCDEAVRLDDGDNDGVTVKTKHLRTARSLLNGGRKG